MLKTILLLLTAIFVLCCESSDVRKGRTLTISSSMLCPSDEADQSDQRESQDTLPGAVVDLVFKSDYYRRVNHPYLKTGGLSLFVLPHQEDTLIHFQLVNNRPDRMQPISNLRYSFGSGQFYEYDVFNDTIRVLNSIDF